MASPITPLEPILPLPESCVRVPYEGHFLVVEDDAMVDLYRRHYPHFFREGFVVSWADLPGRADEVEWLIVYGTTNDDSRFRKAGRFEHDLRPLHRLRRLDVPCGFAAGLSPDALPASLEWIGLEGRRPAAVFQEGPFPGVKVVEATYSIGLEALRFEPWMFPDLREVAAKLDAGGRTLDAIASYPHLTSAWLGPVKDASVLRRLSATAVDFLWLQGGTLPSLDGLQAIRGLRRLKLKGLTKLEDASALRECRDLEVLEIDYCGRFGDVATLLAIPGLKSLFSFRNRAIGKEALRAAFAAGRPGVMLRAWG